MDKVVINKPPLIEPAEGEIVQFVSFIWTKHGDAWGEWRLNPSFDGAIQPREVKGVLSYPCCVDPQKDGEPCPERATGNEPGPCLRTQQLFIRNGGKPVVLSEDTPNCGHLRTLKVEGTDIILAWCPVWVRIEKQEGNHEKTDTN